MKKKKTTFRNCTLIFAFMVFKAICTQAQTPQFATTYKPNTTNEIFGHRADSITRKQNIYFRSDFAGIPSIGTINAVYVRVNYIWPGGSNPPTVPDFGIQMGQTLADSFHTTLPIPFITGLTQVFHTPNWSFSAPLNVGQWLKIPLQKPFDFSFGQSNLVVELYRGDMPVLDNSFTINDLGTQGANRFRSNIGRRQDAASWSPATQTITAIGLDLAPTAVYGVSAPELNVYPNPATDRLFVANPPSDMKYRLTDVTGRVLQSGILTQNGIDIRSLKPGMYLLHSEAKDVSSAPTRFIKE